jgi:hypothetical protein
MKQALSNLSSKLKALHKHLLQVQVCNAEEIDERRYNTYHILQMAIHDARFEWLRKLSSMIAQIDHRIHSEEEIEILDLQSVYDEVFRLFNHEYPEFSTPYQRALNLDPHLYLKQAEVLSALQELQPFIHTMHEMHAVNEKLKFVSERTDEPLG